MEKGYFITFEGGEGSGKTTLIENINNAFLSKNLATIVTREPGGTKFGEHVRKLLLDQSDEKITSKAELCLFLASRSQHIQDVILPNIKSNKIVLCDRFNDSSIAYQGHARGLGIESVIKFSSYILEDLEPDLTFYLDIDPKIGLSRVKGNLDRIESEALSFHEKIREGFHILAKKYSRIKMLDATKSPEEVYHDALIYLDFIR